MHRATSLRQPLGSRVEFGPVASFANLSVVPLLDASETDAGYLTLDEAVAAGAARVTELSDEGQVSRLAVDVRGDRPVLLLDGEELIGAKQNRVANLTILLLVRAADVRARVVRRGRAVEAPVTRQVGARLGAAI